MMLRAWAPRAIRTRWRLGGGQAERPWITVVGVVEDVHTNAHSLPLLDRRTAAFRRGQGRSGGARPTRPHSSAGTAGRYPGGLSASRLTRSYRERSSLC
ncbi:MAG: hypothetical protein GY856_21920 [bacterium]|nr:hypothetical protein [bacterium]